jgi:hypothetical protein
MQKLKDSRLSLEDSRHFLKIFQGKLLVEDNAMSELLQKVSRRTVAESDPHLIDYLYEIRDDLASLSLNEYKHIIRLANGLEIKWSLTAEQHVSDLMKPLMQSANETCEHKIYLPGSKLVGPPIPGSH